VPHQIVRSWYTGCWWLGCYIWYSEEGLGRAAAPPSPRIAVPNVTAHPSTARVPITVLLNDAPLLCGVNVAIKGTSLQIRGFTQWRCRFVCLSVCSFVHWSVACENFVKSFARWRHLSASRASHIVSDAFVLRWTGVRGILMRLHTILNVWRRISISKYNS